ncbi:MAG: hypothetical protein WDZ40_04375 [Candidatus Spechtbacterales bacterium]
MKIEYATYISTKNKAPEKILELIDSGGVGNILGIIYSRYGITNQKISCTQIVGHVLVGLIPIKRFIQALQEDAGLDESTAKNIAHDVRAEIFAPVARELAAMQEQAIKNWQELHASQETSNPQNTNFEQENEKLPTPDEGVVREVFPAPEVNEKKFDDGLEKSQNKEEEKDERF